MTFKCLEKEKDTYFWSPSWERIWDGTEAFLWWSPATVFEAEEDVDGEWSEELEEEVERESPGWWSAREAEECRREEM